MTGILPFQSHFMVYWYLIKSQHNLSLSKRVFCQWTTRVDYTCTSSTEWLWWLWHWRRTNATCTCTRVQYSRCVRLTCALQGQSPLGQTQLLLLDVMQIHTQHLLKSQEQHKQRSPRGHCDPHVCVTRRGDSKETCFCLILLLFSFFFIKKKRQDLRRQQQKQQRSLSLREFPPHTQLDRGHAIYKAEAAARARRGGEKRVWVSTNQSGTLWTRSRRSLKNSFLDFSPFNVHEKYF